MYIDMYKYTHTQTWICTCLLYVHIVLSMYCIMFYTVNMILSFVHAAVFLLLASGVYTHSLATHARIHTHAHASTVTGLYFRGTDILSMFDFLWEELRSVKSLCDQLHIQSKRNANSSA